MKVLQLGLLLGMTLGCNRLNENWQNTGITNSDSSTSCISSSVPVNEAAKTPPTQPANPIRDMLLDAGVSIQRMKAEHLELTAEEVDKMQLALFGDLARHTIEESRIIAFVETYLDQMRPPYGRPRRFLVYREPRGWAVSVITLEALKRLDRASGFVVHVAEEKGRLRITHLTNNG